MWALQCVAVTASLFSNACGRHHRSQKLGVIDNVGDSSVGASAAAPGLWEVYNKHIRGAKHIDLTHAFSPRIPVWPGFGHAEFGAGVAGQDIEGYVKKGDVYTYEKHGFEAARYTLFTDQYGTQLDPPAHWNEFGATISDLPATFAVRPLVVIDVHDKVAKDPTYNALAADVEDWEDVHGRVPEGSVVMFRSDYSKKWDEYMEKGLPSQRPGVSLDAIRFLHHERGILFHGHETLDTDNTPNFAAEAWLLHENFAQAEGVTNLDQVPLTGCLVSIGFAKPLGGIGGYARYVAICPEDTPNGVTIADAPGAPLPTHSHPLRRNEQGVMQPTPGAEATKYCASKIAAGCNPDGTTVWEKAPPAPPRRSSTTPASAQEHSAAPSMHFVHLPGALVAAFVLFL